MLFIKDGMSPILIACEKGFVEVVKGHYMPTYYYKGRLMVEYLMDIKGLTYDEILKDSRTEIEVFDELVNWVKVQK